ncbi:hypothetical protein RA210_U470003 [Rubrivivax sp. A210]|nr:hypothetical protein RA210_U470003 [Rubrivivax sp. A210]
MVLRTFSPARAWRPAVAARLARTLGISKCTFPHPSAAWLTSARTESHPFQMAQACMRSGGLQIRRLS